MAGVPVEFRTWYLPHTSQKLYAWSSFINGTHVPSDLRPVPKPWGGRQYKLPGHCGLEEGIWHVFVFLYSIIIHRLHKLTLWDQDQITLIESQSFRIIGKIFSWCVRAWFYRRNGKPHKTRCSTQNVVSCSNLCQVSSRQQPSAN
jgi:hypothetical protein